MNRIRLSLFTEYNEYVSDEDFDGIPQQHDILEIKGYGYRVLYYKWKRFDDGMFRKVCIVKKFYRMSSKKC